MQCLFCGGDTKVTNSRPQKRSNSVWRRRKCLDCGTIFTSSESIDLSGSIVVQTVGGLEGFSRDKLYLSVYESLKHRETAQRDATELTDTIIKRLIGLIVTATISTATINRTTCSVLQSFDKAAAVQYRAFHPLATD